jgi:molybdate transport system ATP-binding protein
VRAHGPLSETVSRLDLPLHLGEDRGVVLDAQVDAVDGQWHLARLAFDGGQLWTPDPGLPPGRRLRVRLLARDVSLAREHPGRSSIQNVMRGVVEAWADERHPGLVIVAVRVGAARVLARLTRRSLDALQLQPGDAVWVQVKSVALME